MAAPRGLKGRALDREAVEDAAPPPRRDQPITRPSFIAEERGLTPAQRGTAGEGVEKHPGSHALLALQRLGGDGQLLPQPGQAVRPLG